MSALDMRARIALWVLVSTLVSPLAHADVLFGTRGAEAVGETRDEVRLTMEHGHATLVVRRTLHNAGKEIDQAELRLDTLPLGAVATGLRTRGTKNGEPIWFEATLLEAEAAAQKYRELTGLGGFYPKDPALLSWGWDGPILQLFPIEPGGSHTVEYTIEAPTSYVEGRDVLDLPRIGTDACTPEITISSSSEGDVIHVGDGTVESGTTFPLGALGATISVSRDPQKQPPIDGAYAAILFAKGRTLVHEAIEAAPTLSHAPKEAWVVVALDVSRSMSVDARSAELSAARAYLSNLPDAHVQLLGYARSTEAWTKGFVSAKEASDVLSKREIVGKNGSAVDLALDEAARRLDTFAPSDAPRRVLVLGDLRTRASLAPHAVVATATASKAIVHLATIADGAPNLSRDDDGPWSEPPRATGGLLWHARAPVSTAANAYANEVFEEWARPLRIDRIVVRGDGVAATEIDTPGSLKEGEGFDALQIVEAAPMEVVVHGELWSKAMTTKLVADDAQKRLWSALVTASSLEPTLSDSEEMTLAVQGHAVSRVTSLLAVEPGVRPSTGGFDQGGIGLSSYGTVGHGGGFGTGIGIGSAQPFDAIGWLKKALALAAKPCAAQGKGVTVHFETTSAEIVDVSISPIPAPKGDAAKMRTCLEEAAWAIDLPKELDETWAVYDVKLP